MKLSLIFLGLVLLGTVAYAQMADDKNMAEAAAQSQPMNVTQAVADSGKAMDKAAMTKTKKHKAKSKIGGDEDYQDHTKRPEMMKKGRRPHPMGPGMGPEDERRRPFPMDPGMRDDSRRDRRRRDRRDRRYRRHRRHRMESKDMEEMKSKDMDKKKSKDHAKKMKKMKKDMNATSMPIVEANNATMA